MSPVRREGGWTGQFGDGGHGWGVFGLERDFSVVGLVDDVEADAGEDDLVEESLGVFGHAAVEVASLAHEVDDGVDTFTNDQCVRFGGADDSLCSGDLGGDLVLPWADVFGRDDPIKVGVDESLLLGMQRAESRALCLREFRRLGAFTVEDLMCRGARQGGLFGGELHAGVPFAPHGLLDFVDGDVWEVAGCAAGVSAEAEEVAVDAAAAFGVPVSHASAAAVADQSPFERVVVLP